MVESRFICFSRIIWYCLQISFKPITTDRTTPFKRCSIYLYWWTWLTPFRRRRERIVLYESVSISTTRFVWFGLVVRIIWMCILQQRHLLQINLLPLAVSRRRVEWSNFTQHYWLFWHEQKNIQYFSYAFLYFFWIFNCHWTGLITNWGCR